MQGELNDIDKLTSKEDLSNIKKIFRIKKQMTSYIDRKKILDEMLGIIDVSECLLFSSDRSKKFIDQDRPVFKLKIDIPKSVAMYSKELNFNEKKKNTEKEIVDFRMSVIYIEIVKPFSEILRSALKNVDTNLLKEIPDAIEIAEFIVSSMFQVKLESVEDNVSPICYIEYTL
jgi:hypothetical protein